VTKTISPPVRILALVGVAAALGLGAFVFMNRSSSDNGSSAVPAASSSTTQHVAKHAVAASRPAAKPKVVLLPNLPTPIARKLRYSKVVVVPLFTRGGNGDAALVAQARAGAKSAHAGFVAINLLDERSARNLSAFVGTTTAPPVVLVVKRPGKITNRFDGFADSEMVAQAATNAGASAR